MYTVQSIYSTELSACDNYRIFNTDVPIINMKNNKHHVFFFFTAQISVMKELWEWSLIIILIFRQKETKAGVIYTKNSYIL